MSDAEPAIDDSMQSLRFRDVCTDTLLARHEDGILGEATVAKHHSDHESFHAIDDTLSRDGDDGSDLTIQGWDVDVKSTSWGYSDGCTPLLRVKRDNHKRRWNSSARTRRWPTTSSRR